MEHETKPAERLYACARCGDRNAGRFDRPAAAFDVFLTFILSLGRPWDLLTTNNVWRKCLKCGYGRMRPVQPAGQKDAKEEKTGK
ncbi:MAG: hypothetical protein GC185_12045 [Alphaproteobacteria bacterium]|nr:hypothetical protein [Alphaproteobacteria bacterium]